MSAREAAQTRAGSLSRADATRKTIVKIRTVARRFGVALAMCACSIAGVGAAFAEDMPASLAEHRSRRPLLVPLLRRASGRDRAPARPALARDADVRQGGRLQRRLALVSRPAAGDVRRAPRAASGRRSTAPRQRRGRGGMAVQRRSSVEQLGGAGERLQQAVGAMGAAAAPGRFRRARRGTLRHAAQRASQSVPAARRESEPHERRLGPAPDGAHADAERRRRVYRRDRHHVLHLSQRPGRRGDRRRRARASLRQQRPRRREPAAHGDRRREQRLRAHEPEPRPRQRQHHQLPALRAAHALRLPDHAAGGGAESVALAVRQHRQRGSAELVEPRSPAREILRRRDEQRLHADRALLVHAGRRDAEFPRRLRLDPRPRVRGEHLDARRALARLSAADRHGARGRRRRALPRARPVGSGAQQSGAAARASPGTARVRAVTAPTRPAMRKARNSSRTRCSPASRRTSRRSTSSAPIRRACSATTRPSNRPRK